MFTFITCTAPKKKNYIKKGEEEDEEVEVFQKKSPVHQMTM